MQASGLVKCMCMSEFVCRRVVGGPCLCVCVGVILEGLLVGKV